MSGLDWVGLRAGLELVEGINQSISECAGERGVLVVLPPTHTHGLRYSV